MFSKNLFFYCSFINCILIGIWITPLANNLDKWNSFKTKQNQFSKVKWTVNDPSTATIFLDQSLTMKNQHIIMCTYQTFIFTQPTHKDIIGPKKTIKPLLQC
jgi:hypothetical protein